MARSWPDGPLRTDGRAVLNRGGSKVTYAGVNWPAHGESMIPEGLQYQAIETIVSKIKSLGMNSVRLTFAVEMVDQIMTGSGEDVPLETSLINALGTVNGTKIYQDIMSKNPTLRGASRLQVFDAVVDECAKHEIYVHLDNHVSRAMWCCDMSDGNSWFADKHFDVANWTRALNYMAAHARQKWPSAMSISLRNELRPPLDDLGLFRNSYNWQTWYDFIKEGARAAHAGNPDMLIFLPGMDGGTTLRPVVQGTPLTPGAGRFDVKDFEGMSDKLVLDLHNYANIMGSKGKEDCTALAIELHDAGFAALSDAPRAFPVVLSEFGFEQRGEWNGSFAGCIEDLVGGSGAGWMVWSLAGSYYTRQGVQDYDDAWGLLAHDWSEWRSLEHVERGLKPMVEATLRGGAAGTTGWNLYRTPPARVRTGPLWYAAGAWVIWLIVLLQVFRSRDRSRRLLHFVAATAIALVVLAWLNFEDWRALKLYLYMTVLSADRG